MTYLIENGNVYLNGRFERCNLYVDDMGLLTIGGDNFSADEIIDASGLTILPGLIDPHVHLREPGFEYKETIDSGSQAGACGGFTTIFSMPNLRPAPDSVENLKVQLDIIEKRAKIHVIPIASITKGQKGRGDLADIDDLSKYVRVFSDDGVGVQSKDLMREAMVKISKNGGMITEHCEDMNELKPGACIHDGKRAEELNLVGINSASEANEVTRNISLSKETGCPINICHVSAKESVEAIRKGKEEGVKVTAEVTVHHLLCTEDDIKENDGNWKMNPPLRTKEDRRALLEAIKDGTIDMICTDHAPHSKEEKSRGLEKSPFGIIGLEFAFPLIYSYIVREGYIELERAIDMMSSKVAEVFNIGGGRIQEGKLANLCIYDLNTERVLDKTMLKSKSSNTPFLGWKVYCSNKMTMVDGKVVYREEI